MAKIDLRQINRILKALANERRLKILDYLSRVKSASVGDISNYLNLSFKSTSGHLTILERAGLLERKQKGLYVFYSIDQDRTNLVKSTLKII